MGKLAEDVALHKNSRPEVKTAILLAGGQSSRMGKDKALLELGDETLLNRSIRRLSPLFPELVVASNNPHLEIESAQVVKDAVPFLGPLGGILAGLQASSSPLNLVVAVDMPFVKLELIRLLLEEAEEDVTCPVLTRGPEPLLAVYGKGCLSILKKHFDDRDLKTVSFFSEVRVKYLTEQRIREADPDLSSFYNINTYDDLQTARTRLGGKND